MSNKFTYQLVIVSDIKVVDLGDFSNPIPAYQVEMIDMAQRVFTNIMYHNDQYFSRLCNVLQLDRANLRLSDLIGRPTMAKVFENEDDKTKVISLKAAYFDLWIHDSSARYFYLSPKATWTYEFIRKYEDNVRQHIQFLKDTFNFTYPDFMIAELGFNLTQPIIRTENMEESVDDDFPDTYYIGDQIDYDSEDVDPVYYHQIAVDDEEMEVMEAL